MESIVKKIINQLSINWGLIFTAFFFVIGVLTLPGYGINWDTINHLPRGQAYLNYFLTGHKDYNNLPKWFDYWQDPSELFITTNGNKIPERSLYQSDATPFSWYMENDGGGHPPLSDILSSLFNFILFQKLHLINDIDAYRVYGIFLASLLVFVLYKWVCRTYGNVAGFIASLSLALYPLFWSETHFNTEKDIPETVYWSLAIFSTWKAFTEKNWRWLILLGIFLGLALGTKFNILFLPLVLIPWLTVFTINNRFSIHKYKFDLGGIIAPVACLILFVGSWPYLWPDPINRIKGVFSFYKEIGTSSSFNPNFLGPLGMNTYPIQWIIYTTPVVILIFGAVGILVACKRLKFEKDKVSLLFLLWLVIPVLRVSWPGTNVYGGIRQIMEYIPALAVLSGLGGSTIYYWLKSLGIRPLVGIVLLIFSFCPLIWRLYEIHPNENVYFNFLIGGLKGAEEKNLPAWGNSFGAAYRQGVKWLNTNADPNSKVAFGHELLPNIPNIWLRPDLTLHNTFRSGELKNGEYVIGLTYEGTEKTAYFDNYLDRALIPIYKVEVDEVSILKVWKNDFQHTRKQFIDQQKVEDFKLKEDNSVLTIDLPGLMYLSKIEANFQEKNCAKLESARIKISQNNKDWKTMPGKMPNEDWNVPQLGQQPQGNSFMIPFVADKARYIKIIFSPADACLKNIVNLSVLVFPNF